MKESKKKKLQRLYIIAAVVMIILISAILLVLHQPRGFTQAVYKNDKSVSSYLTHELSPDFYGKVQLREAFEIEVTEAGINDIIAHSKWPVEAGEFTVLAPTVIFKKDRIKIIGTVIFARVDFVVTVSGRPTVDKNGMLNIEKESVKVGAINATGIVRTIAAMAYRNKMEEKKTDENDVGAKLARCVILDEPADVVVKIKGETVRLTKIKTEKGRVLMGFEPVGE